MILKEAVSLIQINGIIHSGPVVWADLGCGSGLFTQALASILPSESLIYAVDKDLSVFNPGSTANHIELKKIETDFVREDLPLKNLSGILMANSLHFVRDKKSFLEKLKPYFRYNPVFLIVEYDTDIPNRWVPFPIGFTDLKNLFNRSGYSSVSKINEKPSRYRTGNIYSALVRL